MLNNTSDESIKSEIDEVIKEFNNNIHNIEVEIEKFTSQLDEAKEQNWFINSTEKKASADPYETTALSVFKAYAELENKKPELNGKTQEEFIVYLKEKAHKRERS